MKKGNLSRRGFLQRSLAAMAAAGLPAWAAREALAAELAVLDDKKTVAPGDRIVMGAIGIGSPQSRGRAIYHDAKGQKGVTYVAVCDVDKRHLDNAVADAKKSGDDVRA